LASIYELKPRFQALLRPIVRGLAGGGVTANQVTVFAMLLSVACGLVIGLWPEQSSLLFLLPVVLFLRMALNAVDGMLAREHDMQSRLGQVLNELGDVISDAVLYLPLALVPGFDARLVVGIVVVAIIGEMTGVIVQTLGGSRRYDGPMGKSDRAFAFSVLALAVGLGQRPGAWLDLLLGLILVLSAYTIINRARRGLAEFEQ
jgi:CDP-diacylglycerol--glycerol-3-phosphate 3-phosphatidyltransferase